ncbi:hypothetical protein GTY83_20705 [Streptomyces sp. SID4928]|uniref:DUF6274 family protein n=1 Tax=unclassified Streptomyces TaxID=2593676 RepID=UPI0001C1892E|nr:DUF6274 family protein [Streptomyces sp. ACT-1]EGE43490.1 hypothetical protein SACT1_4160 [Streptomyces sp. ACT-1]MYR51526.1 hypothetical protein [Streptomyces sp. SID4928]
MSASTARHETRALLRAHLAAASAFRHLTRYCAVCHRLLRLAMEPGGDAERRAPESPADAPQDAAGSQDPSRRPAEDGTTAAEGTERPSAR